MVGQIKKYWPLSSAIDLDSFDSANWHNSSLIWSDTDKKWLAYKSGAGTGAAGEATIDSGYVSAQAISGGAIIGDLYHPHYDYMVYRDGNTYYNKDANSGKVVKEFASPHGSGLKVVLDDAIDRLTTGGNILIRAGEYYMTGQVKVDYSSIGIYGEGRDVTKINSWSGSIHSADVDKLTFKGFTLSGAINFKIDYNSGTDPVLAEDMKFEDLRVIGASAQNIINWGSRRLQGIAFYNGSHIMRGTIIRNCEFKNTVSHGLVFYGDSTHGSSQLVNTLIENCRAIRCGTAHTPWNRDNFDGANWATGFCPTHHPGILNMLIRNCYASGCWETGFYMEGGGNPKIGLDLVGCTAEYCGVEKYLDGDRTSAGQSHKSAQQGYGFGCNDNARFINCTAIGNERGGIIAGVNYASPTVVNCYVDGLKVRGYTGPLSDIGIDIGRSGSVLNCTVLNCSSMAIKPKAGSRVENNYVMFHPSSIHGIDARSAHQSKIVGNVIMGKTSVGGVSGRSIIADNADNVTIMGNRIVDFGWAGIEGGPNCKISDNYISGGGQGIITQARVNPSITDNYIIGCTSIGIYVKDANATTEGGIVSDNTVINATDGIHADNRCLVQGNYISGCSDNGIEDEITGRHNNIVGNTVIGCTTNGIWIEGSSSRISDNVVIECGDAGINIQGANHLIADNICVHNGVDGSQPFGIFSQGKRCQYEGNRCYDDYSTKTQYSGLRESSVGLNNIYNNNYMSGAKAMDIDGAGGTFRNNYGYPDSVWSYFSSQVISGGAGGLQLKGLTDGANADALHTHAGLGSMGGSMGANIGSDFTYGLSGLAFVSSQKISGGTIIGKFYHPYDYIVYREDDIYYAKDTKNGSILSEFDSPNGSGLKVVIDAATAELSNGGNILIRAGTHHFSGTITIPSDNIGLIGEGRDITKLNSWSGQIYGLNREKLRFKGFSLSGANIYMEYTASNDPPIVHDMEYENLRIVGYSGQNMMNWNNSYMLQGIEFYVGNNIMKNTKIKDCIIEKTFSHGIGFHGTDNTAPSVLQDMLIDNCRFIRCGTEHTPYNQSNWHGANWGSAIMLTYDSDIKDVTISNCFASGCWECGYYLEGGNVVNGLNYINCHAEYTGAEKFKDGRTYYSRNYDDDQYKITALNTTSNWFVYSGTATRPPSGNIIAISGSTGNDAVYKFISGGSLPSGAASNYVRCYVNSLSDGTIDGSGALYADHKTANQRFGFTSYGNTRIVNCTSIGDENRGFRIDGGTSGNCVVTNCFVDGKGANDDYLTEYGITIGENGVVSNCFVCNVSSQAIRATGPNTLIKGNTIVARREGVKGTAIATTAFNGVYTNEAGTRIEDNLIIGSGANYNKSYGINVEVSGKDCQVINNRLHNTGIYGAYIVGDGCLVKDNYISGANSDNILVYDSNTVNTTIINNTLLGYTSEDIDDNGTSTSKTITIANLEELTDGSQTTLHSHAAGGGAGGYPSGNTGWIQYKATNAGHSGQSEFTWDKDETSLNISGNITSYALSTQAVSGGQYKNIALPADYIIDKDGSVYFVRAGTDGSIVKQDTSPSSCINFALNDNTMRTTYLATDVDALDGPISPIDLSSNTFDLGGHVIRPDSSINWPTDGFNIIQMKRGLHVRNGSIHVGDINFSGHACIEFNGKDRFPINFAKSVGTGKDDAIGYAATVKNMEFRGDTYPFSAEYKMHSGSAIRLITTSGIASKAFCVYHTLCENIKTMAFRYGIQVHCYNSAADETDANVAINGNYFVNYFSAGDLNPIYIDVEYPREANDGGSSITDCAGNMFINYQAETRAYTDRIIYCGGKQNYFLGHSWDVHLGGDHIIEFPSGSWGNYISDLRGALVKMVDSGARKKYGVSTVGYNYGFAHDRNRSYPQLEVGTDVVLDENGLLGVSYVSSTADIYASDDIRLGDQLMDKDNSNTLLDFNNTYIDIWANSMGIARFNPTRFASNYLGNSGIDSVLSGGTLPGVYVDASEDKVGILTNTPSYALDVNGGISATGVSGQYISGGTIRFTSFVGTTDATAAEIEELTDGSQTTLHSHAGGGGSGGYPSGNTGWVQYKANNGGHSGQSELTWDKDTNTLHITGSIKTTGFSSQSISGGSYNIHMPADIIFYREDSTYYARDGKDGSLITADTDCATALNSVMKSQSSVFVNSGTYIISSTIYFEPSSALFGSGYGTEFKIEGYNVNGFSMSGVSHCTFRDAYIRPNSTNYSGSLVILEAYKQQGSSRLNLLDNLGITAYWNIPQCPETVCLELKASGTTNTNNNIAANKFNNLYIKRGRHAILLNASGNVDSSAYINGNYFNNIWIEGSENLISFFGTGSRISRNTFNNIKAQCVVGVTKDGIRDVSGIGNTFSDIILWDFPAGGNYKWSITDQATDTYINHSELGIPMYDSGTRTWGFRRGYGGGLDLGGYVSGATNIHADNLYLSDRIYDSADTDNLINFGDGKIDFIVGNYGLMRMSDSTTPRTVMNYLGSGIPDFIVSGDTAPLIYADAGNEQVGIKTGTPQAELHVVGDISSQTVDTGTLTTHTATIGGFSNAVDTTLNVQTAGYDSIVALRESNNTLGVDLVYSGSASKNAFLIRRFDSDDGNNVLIIPRDSNRVGIGNIGTNAPSYELDVYGSIYASSSISSQKMSGGTITFNTFAGGTNATAAEIEELTDGSQTSLHSHAGGGSAGGYPSGNEGWIQYKANNAGHSGQNELTWSHADNSLNISGNIKSYALSTQSISSSVLNSRDVHIENELTVSGNAKVVGNIDLDGQVRKKADSDTYISFSTGDQLEFVANNQSNLMIKETEATFNEGSNDVDFRVESVNDEYNLFSNGGTDRIGIGTNVPDYKLHVSGSIYAKYGISGSKISGGAIVGDLHTVYDYNIYKIDSTYYAKKTSDGTIVDSNATLETVLNSVSNDITTAATIGFNGDTTYTFANQTVTFTDKLVYIDGNFAEFDIDASDCTVFCWFNDNFTGHMHGGIRNCYVNGDRTNTNQIFANFSGTSAYVNNVHTRNIGDRAVYNMIRITNGGTHSTIRDCFIRGSYPIRLMGSATGEAQRTVIDHCHIGDTADSNQFAIIGIQQRRGQNVSIINNHFAQNFICYSGSAITTESFSDLRLQNNCFAGISSATGAPTTEGHAIMLSGCIRTSITDNIFKLASPSSTYIRMMGDTSYAGTVSDNIFHSAKNKVTAIHTYGNIKRLNIENNIYTLAGSLSGCRFLYQEDPHGFANNWVVADNQITSPQPQEGTCMTFEDLRNSWIHDNIISTEEPGGHEYNGNIGFSVADYTLDGTVRNVICDRYVSANSAHTALMGETIEANATDSGFTITLPTYHTYKGMRTAITIKKTDSSNDVTIDAGSDTIDGEDTYVLANQYDTVTVFSDGKDWYTTLPSSAAGGSTSPAGDDTQVQFNDGGSFGADTSFKWYKNSNWLDVATGISSNNISIDSSLFHADKYLETQLTFYPEYIDIWADSQGVARFNSTRFVSNYLGTDVVDTVLSGANLPCVYVDASEDKVGINKSNPAYDLEVEGTIWADRISGTTLRTNQDAYFGDDIYVNDVIYCLADQNTAFRFLGDDALDVVCGGVQTGYFSDSKTILSGNGVPFIHGDRTNNIVGIGKIPTTHMLEVDGTMEATAVSSAAISGAWRAPRYDGPRPNADASNEGLIIVSGATGKQSFVYICVGNSTSGYEWVQLGVST